MQNTATSYVFWPKRNMTLRVLSEPREYAPEDFLTVCKAECPAPLYGQFTIRADQVVPA